MLLTKKLYDIELEKDPMQYKKIKPELKKPEIKQKWAYLDDFDFYTKILNND